MHSSSIDVVSIRESRKVPSIRDKVTQDSPETHEMLVAQPPQERLCLAGKTREQQQSIEDTSGANELMRRCTGYVC